MKRLPPDSRGWVFRPTKTAEDFIKVTVDQEATSFHRVAKVTEATFVKKPSAMLISMVCAHFPDAHVVGAFISPRGAVELVYD